MSNIKVTVEIEGDTATGKGIDQNWVMEKMNDMGFIFSTGHDSPSRSVMVFLKGEQNEKS